MNDTDEHGDGQNSPPVEHIRLGDNIEQAELTALLEASRSAVRAGRGVTVDCSGPSFLPTAAVQILAALRRTCRERGLPFAVGGVQEPAVAHLRRAGLGELLDS